MQGWLRIEMVIKHHTKAITKRRKIGKLGGRPCRDAEAPPHPMSGTYLG